nr:reverse transcriptase domain-containing protein, chloroplastic [Tanacetum cinerariifolium]
MTDNRTMAEMLRAPTEGCAEAIVVPLILAEKFELKHSLINMMTSEQFFGLEKDNPHDHIRWFNKITSTIKYKDVLNSVIKLILFPFSLAEADHRSEIAKLRHAVNQQTSAVTNAMTAMLKQLQTNPPPAQVKVVEEICVTCGGGHSYYQCLAAGDNTFPEFRDNIQGYVSAAASNYNQGNLGYRPQGVANQMRPPGFVQPNVQNNQNRFGQPQGFNRGTNFNQEQPYQATFQSNQNFHLNELEKIKRMNDVSMKSMHNQIDMVKNELRNEMKTSIQTSLSNQTNEIKNMMASLLRMNTASTSGSGSLPGNTVANPKGKLKAITTRSGLVTDGPTVPTPPKSVTLEEDECVEETYTDPDLAEYTIKVPPPPVQKPKPPVQRNFVLHTRDSPLLNIPELKCKALADLGASINLMPLYVWKKLGLPDLIPTRVTLELANRAICTPDGIARDVFVSVGKFIFPADFVIVDYESDPRVPLILGRPFLRTAHALIDVHGEEMILRDGDERLTLNIKHDTASYSNHLHRESVNLINIFNISSEDCLECDIESDLREIEFLLYQGEDSDLKDSIDQTDLANLDAYFVDPTPEMFNDEHALDYSFPPRFEVYDDDFLEIESDADNFYDDPFDSKGEKIKESKLFIDELDLPYNVFNLGILIHEKFVQIITRVSQEKKLAISKASLVIEDFDPPFYEPLVFKDVPNSMRLLPFSSENEEKVFKPGIYTSEKGCKRRESRSLPTEWRTHTLIWRNKTDLEDQSLDDLFNNLKIYEAEVKSSSSTSPTTQNIAFVSSQNTDSINESVSVVTSVSAASTKVLVSALPNVDNLSDVVIYSFFASQSNSPQLDNDDLKQIDADDLKEMDLKWQMAMLTMRAMRFLQRTGRNLGANGTTSIGFDMSKVECYNCHKRGHFARKCRSPRDTRNKDTQRKNVPVDTSTSNALVSQYDGVGLESVESRLVVYQQNKHVFKEDIKLLKLDVMLRDNALVELRMKFEKVEQEIDELKLKLENFQTSSKNLSKLLARQITDKTGLGYDNQVFNGTVFDCDELICFESDVSMPPSLVHDRYQSGERYHAVPPPYTGTFMPPKPDLVFHDAPTTNETVPTVFNVEPSTTKPNKDLSQSNRPSAYTTYI